MIDAQFRSRLLQSVILAGGFSAGCERSVSCHAEAHLTGTAEATSSGSSGSTDALNSSSTTTTTTAFDTTSLATGLDASGEASGFSSSASTDASGAGTSTGGTVDWPYQFSRTKFWTFSNCVHPHGLAANRKRRVHQHDKQNRIKCLERNDASGADVCRLRLSGGC